MKIDSSVLFYRLSQEYPIMFDRQQKSAIELNSVRIGIAKVINMAVHIVSSEENSKKKYLAERYKSSAFIILGEAPDEKCAPNVAYAPEAIGIGEFTNCVLRVFNSLADWDCRLMEACLDGRDFEHFFKVSREMLDYSYAILDGEMRNVARTRDYLRKFKYFPPEPEKVADSAAEEFFLDNEFRKGLETKDVFIFPEGVCEDKFICYNIAEGDRNIARFQAILDDHNVSGGEFQLFRHISKYAERLYLHIVTAKHSKRQTDILRQLMTKLLFEGEHMPRRTISKTLSAVGWEIEDSYSVSIIRFINKADFTTRLLYLCRKLEEAIPMSCVVHDGSRIVWVINHTRSAVVYFSEYASLLRDLMCKVGTSDSFADLPEIGIYCRQAAVALEIGESKNEHLWHYYFSDYKYEYLMLQATSEFSVRQVVHAGLIKLIEYDMQNDMNYVETIKKYIGNQFNASVSANELYVHRSTFLRRLERIEQISGIDLSNQDDVLYLMLSLRLLEK